MAKVTCKGCHRIFDARPFRIKAASNGLYCSKKCRNTSTHGEMKCLGCGKIFTGYFKNLRGIRQYCSLSCRRPWNKGKTYRCDKLKQAAKKRGGLKGTANPRWDFSVGQRKCKTCKKTFRPTNIARVKVGYGIYCSRTCYQKAKGESVPEQLTRQALDTLGEIYHPQFVMGFFTVDFYLPFKSIVLEVDGDWWHDNPSARRRDKAKTTYLSNRGYKVIRLKEATIRANARQAVSNAIS